MRRRKRRREEYEKRDDEGEGKIEETVSSPRHVTSLIQICGVLILNYLFI
jgi:hypothetical protein